MAVKKPEHLLNKNFLLLILISLITSFGYTMISTLISSYAVELGSNLAVAGTVAGIFSISALFSRPLSGYATDLLNRKRMCVLSTLLIGIALLGYLAAPGIGVFFLVRIIHGLAFGISGTANLALVSEYIPDKNMGEGIGYFGLGQVMAQVAGPAMGIYIKNMYGYKTLFLLIALLTFSAVFLLGFFLKYKTDTPSEVLSKRRNRKITFKSFIATECIVYALIAGLFSLENGIVNSFLILIGTERSIPGISLFFSVNAIVLFIMRLTIGKVADKTSLLYLVDISLGISIVSMILTGRTSSFLIMMIAAALKAIGQGGGQISLQSACIKKVSPEKVGIATSTYYIGADIGQGLGPIIGGNLSDKLGYSAMFYCIAVLLALAIVVFSLYEKKMKSTNGNYVSTSGIEDETVKAPIDKSQPKI